MTRRFRQQRVGQVGYGGRRLLTREQIDMREECGMQFPGNDPVSQRNRAACMHQQKQEKQSKDSIARYLIFFVLLCIAAIVAVVVSRI